MESDFMRRGYAQDRGQHSHMLLLAALLLLIGRLNATYCGEALGTADTIYTMDSDCVTNGTNGLTVTNYNVTIDCAGFSITGNNATNTYGIYTDQQYTNIMNCNIQNFRHGIFYNTAKNGTIENTNSSTTHATGYGIYLYNGANNNIISNTNATGYYAGIYILTSSNNTISNSTVASIDGDGIDLGTSSNNIISNTNVTSYYDGIGLYDSSNNIISNTNIISYYDGIYLSSSSNNTITNSTVASIDGDGIDLGTSSYNTITNSIGTSTSDFGIRISSSNYNTIINSTGTGTGIYGILIGFSINNTINNATGTGGISGLKIYYGQDNNISNSRFTGGGLLDDWFCTGEFYGAVSFGCIGDSGETGNRFFNNTITSSLGNATLLFLSEGASGNFFYWNNFTDTSMPYVNDTNGSNFYNLSEGNIWFNMNSSNLTGTVQSTAFPNYKVATGGASYPYNNSTSGDKFVCNFVGCGDYAPLFYSPPTPTNYCAENLNIANTVYTMTANCQVNGTTAFNITANNVTLNCAGFSIIGDNSSGVTGIYAGVPISGGSVNNTTIIYCNIHDFEDFINIDGGYGSNILWNNLSAQIDGVTGLYYGTGDTLETFDGIASFNRFNFTPPAAGSATGIRVGMGSNLTFTNNTIWRGGADGSFIGFDYGGGSIKSMFKHNNISILNGAGDNWVSVSTATPEIDFNDSTSGNIWCFTDGTCGWTKYQWLDTNGDNYADTGTGIPVNATTATDGEWIGANSYGDAHPFTLSGGTVNAPPAINSVSIETPPLDATSTLSCVVNATDSENTTLDILYKLWNTGIAEITGTFTGYLNGSLTTIISKSGLTAAQNWQCEVTATDGSLSSAAVNSSTVQVVGSGTSGGGGGVPSVPPPIVIPSDPPSVPPPIIIPSDPPPVAIPAAQTPTAVPERQAVPQEAYPCAALGVIVFVGMIFWQLRRRN